MIALTKMLLKEVAIVCGVRTNGYTLEAKDGLHLTYAPASGAVICERDGQPREFIPLHAVVRMWSEPSVPAAHELSGLFREGVGPAPANPPTQAEVTAAVETITQPRRGPGRPRKAQP